MVSGFTVGCVNTGFFPSLVYAVASMKPIGAVIFEMTLNDQQR